MVTNLLAGVLEAQTRNSLLNGDELARAARALIDVLHAERAMALPSDSTGDRILGAALREEPTLRLADRSRRFDDCHVILVAGHISGDAGISDRARRVRALGAVQVGAALLTPWTDHIEGCDGLWALATDRQLSAVTLA